MSGGLHDITNQFEQLEFSVGGLKLAAQRFGAGRKYKLLALHGWLDNSASFECLLPYLEAFDCVAVDLAGHGKSMARPGSGAYNIWQDVREIHDVVEQLGWFEFSLLGHSRGAMIATLYAGSFPEQVRGLCLLDAILPITAEAKDLPRLLRESVLALKMPEIRPKSYFKSFDKAVLARTLGRFPLPSNAARALAKRAVEFDEGKGYFWHYDPRLLVASEIRLSDEQAEAFIDELPCVAQVILASEGLGPMQRQSKQYQGLLQHSNLSVETFKGGHHLHCSSNKKDIIKLAKFIHEYFLQNLHK